MYSSTDLNTAAYLALKLQASPGIHWDDTTDKASFIFDVSSNDAERLINSFFNGANVDAYAFCDMQQRLKSQMYSTQEYRVLDYLGEAELPSFIFSRDLSIDSAMSLSKSLRKRL